MNWKRAVLAGGAGTAGAFVFYISLSLSDKIELSGGEFGLWGGGGERTSEGLSLLMQLLLVLLLYLIVFGVTGTLSGKTLGVGWRRSFLSSVGGHLTALAATLVIGLAANLLVPVQRAQTGALALVLAAALTLMFAVRTFSLPLVVATVMVAAVALPLALIFGGYVGLIAWIVLPATVALTATRW